MEYPPQLRASRYAIEINPQVYSLCLPGPDTCPSRKRRIVTLALALQSLASAYRTVFDVATRYMHIAWLRSAIVAVRQLNQLLLTSSPITSASARAFLAIWPGSVMA